MTSFWENGSMIWSEGIKQMDLVIKDGSGGPRTRAQEAGFREVFSDQSANNDGPGVSRIEV
jgi:hypothetical protein